MNKQIKWGIILQYAQLLLGIVVQLLYTPIMINILGDSEYGIYSLVVSIISYLSLLSLGFGAGYIRFYARYKAKDDQEGIKKLNGLFLTVFSIMGTVALVCGLVIAFNSQIFFNSTYTGGDVELAKILMIFLTINLTISFPASVFLSYVTAHEKFVFQKLLNIGKTVLSPCLCIAVLFMGYGSIGMVVVTTIVSLIVDTLNVIFCVKKLKMRFSFGKWEKGLFKEIAIFCSFIAINQIVDQINWQTDKIILGKMINSVAVAVYAVASTINAMYISFSNAVSSVYVPRVNKIVAEEAGEEQNRKLTNLFIKVGRIQFFVIMLIMTGFIFFGQYFISIWVGEGYELSYFITLLLICPATIPLLQNLGLEIQRAKNKHKFRSIVYLIMAVANIGISIMLCHFCGTIGVAIGTAISLIICNVIVMNIYYQKVIKLDMKKYWKSFLSLLPALILPCIYGTLIMVFYEFKGLLDFGALIIGYGIIYAVCLYLIGFNSEEKSFVKSIFKRLKKEGTTTSKDNNLVTKDKKECCGCGMCANLCPQKCIKMIADSEGFLYPQIDKERCVNCGLCRLKCPVLNAKQDALKAPTCYACYSKNKKDLLKSSSGGVFGLIAEEILKTDGVVYGASFDGAYKVCHIRVDKVKYLDKLRRSKYLQSEIKDTYINVKTDLLANKVVLFTGTACQISGLKHFLGRDYDNLYTQDIICHGVPSQKVWEKYLKENNVTNSAEANFRDKSYGWKNYSVKINNGKQEIKNVHNKNYYIRSFLSDCNLRPSCYDCKFKTLTREADITLADFWGIEKILNIDLAEGVSAVLIHSDKGKYLFEQIKKNLVYKAVSVDDIVKGNPSYLYSAKPHKNREKFFKNLDKKSLKKLERKYINPFLKKCLGKVKRCGKKVVKKILSKFR